MTQTAMVPFLPPRTGRTAQSVRLHLDPGLNEDVVDELEPGYPLEIHGYAHVAGYKWFRVKALAKPPGRDEEQWGWIYAPLVQVDPPRPHPAPRPACRPGALAGLIASVAEVFGLLSILAAAVLVAVMFMLFVPPR